MRPGSRGSGELAVHAPLFERDVARPQVGFLEHPGGDAAAARDLQRGDVHRPAVAEHHQVGDAVRLDQRGERGRPFLRAPGEVGGVGAAPEQPVARGEVHAVHRMAARGQRIAEAHEEVRGEALKEEEGASRHSAALPRRARRRAPACAGRACGRALRRTRHQAHPCGEQAVTHASMSGTRHLTRGSCVGRAVARALHRICTDMRGFASDMPSDADAHCRVRCVVARAPVIRMPV